MQKNSEDFSMQEAMRLAKSPAGQQLFALLQQTDPAALHQAMDQAAAGDYDHVKKRWLLFWPLLKPTSCLNS